MLNAVLNFLNDGLTGAGWVSKLIYILIMTQLTIFTVTLYLHRSQTHRGVDFHPVLAHFFRFWGWLTTGMVTREWVAVHRKHHAKVETEEDPHSPMIYGIKKVFWDGVSLYRDACESKADMTQYGRGTPDDWVEHNVYGAHPYWGPTLMLLINLALFGVIGAAIWALQMVWIPFWAAGFVNGIGHWAGYRNFESADTSRNLIPWGFWIGGEELHNNHHAYPSSAKFALRKWEFDIGWATICGLRAIGLAKVLRVAPSLDVRPNVNLLPDADMLKAVLTHRIQAMTDYYRGVILPTLSEEAQHAGESLKSMPRRIRLAMADGGRWLDSEGRERMQAVLAKRPTLSTVCEFRSRLAALMEQRGADQALNGLQQWIHEAEESGIRALQEFAQRLKGYAVASA
ncbi:fatty acid desaturase [Rhodanobacter sp. MP7CTX1]|uniref:DesA family fatty acid desaturase n=1 Tax=Rhodanobacter sp. MP7CTX1 TaxID=2723084 RepID=UPI00161C8833|nr:fatty acid desaturase [Rhodanobacter sp. MP7CTX1]MBB6188918.1 stearoyl-CoA desaturase (delta-9 desaturase) [Rhodanobacter sp. MP7CTX1]